MKTTTLFLKRSYRRVVAIFLMTTATVWIVSVSSAQEVRKLPHDQASHVQQIRLASETAKHEMLQELSMPLRKDPQKELSRHINMFREGLRLAIPKEQVQQWNERLSLDALQASLQEEETDLELVDAILASLDDPNGEKPDRNRPAFTRLKQSLEKHRPLLFRQNQQYHIEELERFYDSLPELIESYLASPDADNTAAVSEALAFLSSTRKADELITLIRQLTVQPNLKVQVSPEVIAPLFCRDINEPVTVNDNILGTYVRGSGHLTGKSSATFVPNRDLAVIRVMFQGNMSSATVGVNGPVRVHSNNTAAVTTVKDIVITKNSILTACALSDVKQSSQITRVDYMRPGPLVRMVAPNQIRERKPASDAESARLTRRRFNARFDATVDENAAKFNREFAKLINGYDSDLRVDFARLETTQDKLFVDAIVGGRSQLTTLASAPAVQAKSGLFLQIHESLPGNVATCELSGKTLVEEQLLSKLKTRFPKLLENREGKDDDNEPSLTITFSDQPILLSFDDNIIKATVEMTAIERNGNAYPGMVLEVRFRIEAVEDGFQLIVLETPEVLPLGFDRESGQPLTIRETTIRAIIMKKLEHFTEKPIEWKETVIEGENGTITLKPVLLSTANGWLSVGLDMDEWVPNTDSNPSAN